MNIFENKKAFATPLLIQAFNIYGMDLFDMDIDVLTDDLKERFKGIDNTIIDRMLAGVSLYTSNLFFQDPIVFGQTCRVFNRHRYPNANEPTLQDICWGIVEASLILAPEDDSAMEPFSEAVNKYIQFELKYNGVVTSIPSLPMIKPLTETSDIYDPAINAGELENSSNVVNSIEQSIQTNMIQCLQQIAELPVDMAQEAKTQLSTILRGES
jgi:hypothetical protein